MFVEVGPVCLYERPNDLIPVVCTQYKGKWNVTILCINCRIQVKCIRQTLNWNVSLLRFMFFFKFVPFLLWGNYCVGKRYLFMYVSGPRYTQNDTMWLIFVVCRMLYITRFVWYHWPGHIFSVFEWDRCGVIWVLWIHYLKIWKVWVRERTLIGKSVRCTQIL